MSATAQLLASPPRFRHSWTDAKIQTMELMISANKTVKEMSQLVGMSKRAIYRYMENTDSTHTEGPRRQLFRKKRGRKPVDQTALKAHIQEMIRDNPATTMQEIVDELPNTIHASLSKVNRVKTAMGYTRKRIKLTTVNRNTQSTINKRWEYATIMSVKGDDRLFFLDETGFNLHLHQTYGYAVKGLVPTLTVPSNRGKNISVMATISQDGVVAYETLDGAYNKERMTNFINTKLVPHLPQGSTVIMDNARFHHSEVVKTALTEAGVAVQYLPPYCPFLNPIEEFFSLAKAEAKKKIPRAKTREQMKGIIEVVFEEMKTRDLRPFYAHARSYFQRCIDKQIIEY